MLFLYALNFLHNLLFYTEPIPYDRMPMEIKQIEIT